MILKVYENLDEDESSRDRRFIYIGRNQYSIFGVSVDLKKRITLPRPANTKEVKRYRLLADNLIDFVEMAESVRVAKPFDRVDPLALDRLEREDRG